MKENQKIKEFITDTLLIDEKKGKIIISIRKLILKIFPKAEEDFKYGGIVYIFDKRLFSGIFLRKNHISVEFDLGVKMSDPEKLLEGSGKLRRHLKFKEHSDINAKKLEYFLNQLFKD